MIKRLLPILIVFTISGLPAYGGEGEKNCYPIREKDLLRADAPHFDQFQTKQETIKKPSQVNLKSHPNARTFRTVLRRGAAEGPNFAGHYAVVAWGCGTSCVTFAIVNLKTGNVIFPDDFSSAHGIHLDADDFERIASTGYWGLRYKLDSRLLIVVGMLDEDKKREGVFYYILDKDKMKRIFAVNVTKDDCDDRMKD
jgi:hypothetical protein